MTDRLALPRRYRDQLEALLREHVPGVEVWAYGTQALVAEAKAGNPFAPVTVVPPNTYSGIGLRRVLAGDGGLLNVGFMALARLAEQLGAPTMASQRRRPLSAASEMAVIRTVAMEMVGKEPLGSVAGHSSLHHSLHAAFKELVRSTATMSGSQSVQVVHFTSAFYNTFLVSYYIHVSGDGFNRTLRCIAYQNDERWYMQTSTSDTGLMARSTLYLAGESSICN